jgi:uncharacterized membrane protein
MTSLPPIPPWDSLHPLVIHFPIALLLIAPLFILVGAILKPQSGRPYLLAALVLMTLGTAGTWVAVSTGEAAGELAERNPEVSAAIERHEHLAELTRTVFTALTATFAVILLIPKFTKTTATRVFTTALPIVLLVAYGAGSALLANTAHQGGRLVHQLGVTALMAPASGSVAAVPAEPAAGNKSDGD